MILTCILKQVDQLVELRRQDVNLLRIHQQTQQDVSIIEKTRMEASQQRRLLFVGRIDTIRNRELLNFVLELSIASFFAYQIVLNGETIESL